MLSNFPRLRTAIYLVGTFVGLALTATQSGYAAAGHDQPTWLAVAFAVYGVLAAGLGITAASNVTPPVTIKQTFQGTEPTDWNH